MGNFQHQNWGYSSSMCIDVDGDIIVIELDGVLFTLIYVYRIGYIQYLYNWQYIYIQCIYCICSDEPPIFGQNHIIMSC